MAPARRPFNPIAFDLVGPFIPPSSKGNSYILTCAHLLINYSIAIPIPDNLQKTVIQAYLKHMYNTFNGSLTLITDNGKQFKK